MADFCSDDLDIECLGEWRPTLPDPTDALTGVELVLEGDSGTSRDSDTKIFNADGPITIGRVPSSDPARFENSQDRADYFCPVMSRKHARITFAGSEVYIEDTDSHHGTFFEKRRGDGVKIKLATRTIQRLSDGDKVTFGKPVHKNGTDHLPITVRVKLLTMPFFPRPATQNTAGRYGLKSLLFDEDDDEEEDEESGEADMDLDDDRFDGELREISRPPPGAWPSLDYLESPDTSDPELESIERKRLDEPPSFGSPASTSYVEEAPASKAEDDRVRQLKAVIHRLKLDMAKLQQHKKKTRARLNVLERKGVKVDELESKLASLRAEITSRPDRLLSLLEPIEQRLSSIEERQLLPKESNSLGFADLQGVVEEEIRGHVFAHLTEANADVEAAKEEIAQMITSLSTSRAQAETEIAKHVEGVENLQAEFLQKKRRREEEDDAEETMHRNDKRQKRQRVGLGPAQFVAASALGAVALWTSLAFY